MSFNLVLAFLAVAGRPRSIAFRRWLGRIVREWFTSYYAKCYRSVRATASQIPPYNHGIFQAGPGFSRPHGDWRARAPAGAVSLDLPIKRVALHRLAACLLDQSAELLDA